MKFICLGYHDEAKWAKLSEIEANTLIDECFDYDDELRAKGHFAGGEALQPASTAKTLTWSNGRVMVTDGPFAETKEQLGGILILEADSLEHATLLMSKHPGVRNGPFEIRPVCSLEEMQRASEQRRNKRTEEHQGAPDHQGP